MRARQVQKSVCSRLRLKRFDRFFHGFFIELEIDFSFYHLRDL